MGEICVGRNRFRPERLMPSTFDTRSGRAAVLLPEGFVFFHTERFFFTGFVFRNRVHFVAL